MRIQPRIVYFALSTVVAMALLAVPSYAGHGIPYHATFELDGQQEVPPVASDLAGNCVAILHDTELDLSCTFTTAPMAAHIHQGSIGTNGPVIFTLPAERIVQTEITLTEEQANAAIIGDLYVNFHTAEVPSGEIRGQMLFNQVENTWSMTADGSGADQVTPNAEENSIQCRAFGAGGDSPILSVRCNHDVDDATAAHLHSGAAGVAGPVVEGFDSPASPLAKVFSITADQLQAFQDGELYINVHNAAYPGGIVRAQLDNAIAGDTSLALQDGRFEVSVTGASSFGPFVGRARAASDNSGTFSFFSSDNKEVLIKVLDFCGAFGVWGIYYSATTDTAFDLTVTDTTTGVMQTYSNELGQPAAPVADLSSFTSCS